MRVYQFRHVGTELLAAYFLLLTSCCVFCNRGRILKEGRHLVNSNLVLERNYSNPKVASALSAPHHEKSLQSALRLMEAFLRNFVVPTEGLEPPHLAAHGPEPCASTNSATWALMLLNNNCYYSDRVSFAPDELSFHTAHQPGLTVSRLNLVFQHCRCERPRL